MKLQFLNNCGNWETIAKGSQIEMIELMRKNSQTVNDSARYRIITISKKSHNCYCGNRINKGDQVKLIYVFWLKQECFSKVHELLEELEEK